MSHDTQQKNVLYFIREYWVLIAVIIGLITTWTNLKSNQVQANDRISVLETKDIDFDKNQNLISVQLSQIQTDLVWLKSKFK